MMRPFLPVLLGLVTLADAQAATLSIEPDVVPLGGSVVFHVTTERELLPGGGYGPEAPHSLFFTGPCFNMTSFSFTGPHGQAFDVPFPSGGWRNDQNPGCTMFHVPNRIGNYVATLDYTRADGQGSTTHYRIDVPFTVIAKLELRAIPDRIPVGDTVLLETRGLNPGESATSLAVSCAGGGVDHAVSVAPIDEGFATSWPGALFEGTCDSSVPGLYSATLTTDLQSDTTTFSVFGDRDRDGWLDGDDNCPNDPNPGQEDIDSDRRGDECDTDNDNDGIADEEDNCPDVANTSQDDLDVDGLGNACDPDIEDDGVLNAADNCDYHWNPGQEDVDGDTFGDPCDPDPDDSDNDGVNDIVDNCWNVFNPAQQDDDGDQIGTACDPDIDGDGVSNADEATAGTNPNDPQPIASGVNGFFDGDAIGSGASTPDGEPIGVVIDPPAGTTSVGVTVIDPWGSPYSEQTLVPNSPVAFYFVPVWPGTWTVEADPDQGDLMTATFDVIPEPGATAAAVTALIALGLASSRARAG